MLRTTSLLLLLLSCAGGAPTQARTETLAPIRPGSLGKSRFWNEHAKQFMFAPAFNFKSVEGATSYRFTIRSPDGTTRAFEATEPWAPLTPIWAEMPSGRTDLTVEGLIRRGGDVVGVAGSRTFHRAASFKGPYRAPVIPHAESARVALASVIAEPFVKSWRETGQPDPKYPLYRYASKVIGSLISGCAMHASQSPRPNDADDAIETGRRAADFLIGISSPPGAAFEHFPPTYHGAKPTERENDNWTMLMSPAEAGQGYLDLYDVTRDERYLQAAVRIADTYRKTQRGDGTWPLKVDKATGNPIAPIDLIPSVVIGFLDRLGRQYQITAHQPTLDRAVQWVMENPARTFNWQAQFDDAKVRGPYQNLSKHEACEFAAYLFRRAKDDPEKIALAIEILRFAEDQFVVWDNPPDLNPRSPQLQPENWYVPCSLEQYAMFEPISGSSAFMIVAYVRAYHATGETLYLAKAESFANALTVAQRDHDGRYPTRMIKQDLSYWINSTINTARAMQLLSAARQP